MTWHFEDPAAVEALLKAKDEWLDTPFMKHSSAKGPRGGVDCVRFANAMMVAGRVVDQGDFVFESVDADYSSAATARKIMKFLSGRWTLHGQPFIDPRSARLAKIFAKIPVFRHLRKGGNIDPSLFLPGDILILRSAGLFHLPVMLLGRQFVSAIPQFGVREGNIHDTTYSPYLAAIFRARARH